MTINEILQIHLSNRIQNLAEKSIQTDAERTACLQSVVSDSVREKLKGLSSFFAFFLKIYYRYKFSAAIPETLDCLYIQNQATQNIAKSILRLMDERKRAAITIKEQQESLSRVYKDYQKYGIDLDKEVWDSMYPGKKPTKNNYAQALSRIDQPTRLTHQTRLCERWTASPENFIRDILGKYTIIAKDSIELLIEEANAFVNKNESNRNFMVFEHAFNVLFPRFLIAEVKKKSIQGLKGTQADIQKIIQEENDKLESIVCKETNSCTFYPAQFIKDFDRANCFYVMPQDTQIAVESQCDTIQETAAMIETFAKGDKELARWVQSMSTQTIFNKSLEITLKAFNKERERHQKDGENRFFLMTDSKTQQHKFRWDGDTIVLECSIQISILDVEDSAYFEASTLQFETRLSKQNGKCILTPMQFL